MGASVQKRTHFQGIASDPYGDFRIVVSDPIGALAHLQLGRAFALSGDKTKAKAAYHDFLTLWKDADPDIPILEQAEAEYIRLSGLLPNDGQPGSYAEPEVRFREDRLYFVEITGKREPIEFLRGTCFSFHLVSN
jgi:hypothetical protein